MKENKEKDQEENINSDQHEELVTEPALQNLLVKSELQHRVLKKILDQMPHKSQEPGTF